MKIKITIVSRETHMSSIYFCNRVDLENDTLYFHTDEGLAVIETDNSDIFIDLD